MKHYLLSLTFLLLLSGCGSNSKTTHSPGPIPDNRTLLPNGWMLSPAGTHVEVGELPLNMQIHPDGRYAVVTNNGTGQQGISVVDLTTMKVLQTINLANAWVGLKFIEGGRVLLASGGTSDVVYRYQFDDGKLTIIDSIVIGASWPAEKIWLCGLDVDEATNRLFVASRENEKTYVVNLGTKRIEKEIVPGAKPYTCLVSHRHDYVYISLWGGSEVMIIDRNDFHVIARIPVGDHPNDMAETPDGKRLFVANANNNTVSAIDIENKRVSETISSSLYPDSPAGSTPNSVSLNADATRLYVANADNNCLAVMDISNPGHANSLGFIPVGWYPTCVRVIPGSGGIVVANGKGLSSRPNPGGPNPFKAREKEEYIGKMFKGTISRIDQPDIPRLREYTALVYANTPYKNKRTVDPSPENPVPSIEGQTSPIKHVFYIIKENRTYDQVFGDMKEGNGDSSLCLFPEEVTPNLHALARQFVLLDNLYCDAEVSADGHNWSMGAYATDYVEKSWPNSYGGHGGDYEFEGGYPIAYPSAGYIWDNCKRNGVSYRSYGEFVENGNTSTDSARALTNALKGHVAPFYRGWDLDYSDVQRVEDWTKELEEFERNGGLPQFQVLRLPNDHTEGTHSGSRTPRAFVAQNDLALGLFIERLSKSKYWKESAVFIIEDDAQNGPDHVDAHRTVALVISPYIKHGFVDHTMYSTSGMVGTMERILGLPPMSQYDAAATRMFNAFAPAPDPAPYTHRPARINLEERNIAGAYGQKRSNRMNFTHEDAAPDIELNEIIWRSIHGADSAMPAPVRSAFVRDVAKEERDDDD